MSDKVSMKAFRAFFSTACLVWGCFALQLQMSSAQTSQLRLEVQHFLEQSTAELEESEVDFSTDVLPVLSQNCFPCHGPDEEHQEAGLRLDIREEAIDFGAIVPGDVDASEIIYRMRSTDPDLQMPPPNAKRKFDEEDIKRIENWITSGAEYTQHWSFVAPQKSIPPVLNFESSSESARQIRDRYRVTEAEFNDWIRERFADFPRNEIDLFVGSRMLEHGLVPTKPADRYTLARRVSFDLTGLPPSVEGVQRFVNDSSPDAYEKYVDQLLSSPAYGEYWGRRWLDLARYSDTNGYEKDRPRSIWPYRDWVINSLNEDYSFDQFTIDQLAGDMLPGADESSRIATGFHRNTMLNEEGGIDPLEFRYYAVVDRVATTGLTWLGLTTGCAQCHTHKYDPITHKDYYQLMGFFDNSDEIDMAVSDLSIERRQEEIDNRIKQLELDLPNHFPVKSNPEANESPENEPKTAAEAFQLAFESWFHKQKTESAQWVMLKPKSMESNLPKLELLPDGSILSTGDITKRDVYQLVFDLPEGFEDVTAIRLEVLPDESLPASGPGRCYYEGRRGAFFLSEMTAQLNAQPLEFADGTVSYGKIGLGGGPATAQNVYDGNGSTGWATADGEGKAHQLVLNVEPAQEHDKVDGNPFQLEIEMLFERHFAASLGRFRIWVSRSSTKPKASEIPTELEPLFNHELSELTPERRQELERLFSRITPELAEARKPIEELAKQRPDLPTTLIFNERPEDNPRQTHIHNRGEYLSVKEEVTARLPDLFAEMTPENELPQDRLEFAQWLVSDNNPLVGRVAVNRAWRDLFGQGLMDTNGDYGTQAPPPSHPQLLDWLACELVEEGWSLKNLHRQIVLSAVYRQSSVADSETREADPNNKWYAYGTRHRLPADSIRDMALKASGILTYKTGGPGVYPPQPASVTALAYGSTPWNPSTGEDRYRRSIYTYRKRTAPFAAYDVFDAPSGETCLAKRNRSNTPLQALTLLNDAMFVELAQQLAKNTLESTNDGKPNSDAGQFSAICSAMFQRVLTRPPTDPEINQIKNYYQQQLDRIEAGELSADTIAGNEQASKELAAWTLVARVLLNLDEAVTRP